MVDPATSVTPAERVRTLAALPTFNNLGGRNNPGAATKDPVVGRLIVVLNRQRLLARWSAFAPE